MRIKKNCWTTVFNIQIYWTTVDKGEQAGENAERKELCQKIRGTSEEKLNARCTLHNKVRRPRVFIKKRNFLRRHVSTYISKGFLRAQRPVQWNLLYGASLNDKVRATVSSYRFHDWHGTGFFYICMMPRMQPLSSTIRVAKSLLKFQ